jgi:hypothetical protein
VPRILESKARGPDPRGMERRDAHPVRKRIRSPWCWRNR